MPPRDPRNNTSLNLTRSVPPSARHRTSQVERPQSSIISARYLERKEKESIFTLEPIQNLAFFSPSPISKGTPFLNPIVYIRRRNPRPTSVTEEVGGN